MEKSSFQILQESPRFNQIIQNLPHETKVQYLAAIYAVEKGRECLLNYFGKIRNIEEKEKAGLVSEADRESEKLIQKILQQRCPDIDFLGEESSYLEGQNQFSSSKKARWILDPLDGTTNFVHQFPIFCISLGLEINEEISIGIIDMPKLNQTFVAIKGYGAYCNADVLSISKTTEIEKAFMSTGFVAEDENVLKQQLKIFEHFVWKARAIRRPGAAAYDLALIASGVFDLYWERNLKPWDAAAGILLVTEAGGVCRTFEGDSYNAFKKSLVAGPSTLVDKFLLDLKPVIKS